MPTLAQAQALSGAVAARTVVARARAERRARSSGFSLLLGAGLAAVFAVSLGVGDFPIPLRDVVPAILGSGDPGTVFVVRDLRLPRVLSGLLVGVAFGFSGALFQALARNPLASPDVLGFTAGASAAAVLVITVVGSSKASIPAAAFTGAGLSALLVYALAYRRGVSTYRLVLVGIGVGATFQGLTAYLLTRSFIADAAQAIVWLTGSLNGRTWDNVKPAALALLVLAPAALALASLLRVLQLGDDTAKGLGVAVERSRIALLLVGVALVGAGVATAGPIAYVAFVAPPIARRLTHASGPALLPAALTGGLLVLLADLAGQHALSDIELPVGVITGLIGGSYLLWLVARSNRVGRGG